MKTSIVYVDYIDIFGVNDQIIQRFKDEPAMRRIHMGCIPSRQDVLNTYSSRRRSDTIH